MKNANSTSSVLERWIIGVLDVLLAVVLVWFVVGSWIRLQSHLLLATFVLGVAAVLSVAAWRHGFRWFFSRRALRFHAWFVLGIISVIVLFYAEESWRGKRSWAALQREAAARGESLELASVAPPLVPDEENFALAPGVATLLGCAEEKLGEPPATPDDSGQALSLYYGKERRNCPEIGNWAIGQATDLAAWQKFIRRYPLTNSEPGSNVLSQRAFPVAPAPQTPAADVLLGLSRNDAALAVLRAASQRPKVRYPIAYEDGLFGLHRRQEHFEQNLHAAVYVLCLRAVAQLAQDQSDAALEDTLLALRLADSLRQEPYDQLHQWRAAMLQLCLQPVWEGLADHRWKEAQLRTLQQRLADLDLLAEFRVRVRGETLVTMNLADQLHARLEGRRSAWGERRRVPEEERWLIWCLRLAYPVGWLYQDKVWIYRFYERRADAFKALAAAKGHQWEAEARRATDPFLLVFAVPRLRHVLDDGAAYALFFQTACEEAAVACALERYRLAQGQYPDRLEALVPAQLKQLPADLVAQKGTPLKYRREADGGFVLYSIGSNRADDQGKPGSPDTGWHGGVQATFPCLGEGDWVWIQPGR